MSERTRGMIAERSARTPALPRLVGMHCDRDYGHPDGEVRFRYTHQLPLHSIIIMRIRLTVMI